MLINKSKWFGVVLSSLLFVITIGSAQATVVNYSLINVEQDNKQFMTGTFRWTYDEGDFENGVGVFSELYIPGYGTDIDALTINFDIKKSIEFSLTANVHGGGVNVSLFLLSALTPTQAASIDLGRSSYEIESNLSNGGFVSGSISPSAVPVPTAVWLFGTGLIGLIVMPKRYKVQGKIN